MGTILIVDDEALVRRSIRRLLSANGHRVLDADGAESALAQLQPGVVDVVLMDVDMPGRSGVQVLEQIRADPGIASVPVVLMSGRVEASALPEHLQSVPFLTKPFEREDLEALLQQLLGG